MSMRILIVEDDEACRVVIRDAAEDLEGTLGKSIELIEVASLAEAQDRLDQQIDGAIVDLQLTGTTEDRSGNLILAEIVNKKRFPVFVHSGYSGDTDIGIDESVFFQKHDKGSIQVDELITRLSKIHDTGITRILGKGGIMEEQLTDVFWHHVRDSLDQYLDKPDAEKHLLRFIAGHIYEHLEQGTEERFEKYFPEEVYIIPAIKEDFFTGSIMKIKTGDDFFLVLNPACDLANAKANNIIISRIIPFTENPVKRLVDAIKRTPPKFEVKSAAADKERFDKGVIKNREQLEKIMHNSGSPKYYYLPKSSKFQGGVVNFQEIINVEKEKIKSDYDHYGTVSSLFLKDIIVKFSYYYARQGAPDLVQDVSDLLE